MNLLKALTLLTVSIVLSGGLHVQLFGSVGGAQVVIAPLRNTSDIVDRGESRDRQTAYELRGKKNWDSDGLSVLTEAIYQVVRAEGLTGKTDAQVVARMNELASAVVEDLLSLSRLVLGLD